MIGDCYSMLDVVDQARVWLDSWGERTEVDSSVVKQYWYSFSSEWDIHCLVIEFQNNGFYYYEPTEPMIEGLFDTVELGQSVGTYFNVAMKDRVPTVRVNIHEIEAVATLPQFEH